MTVIDSSAMVDALVGTDVDPRLFTIISETLAAPHVLDAEVLNTLRGLELGRKISAHDADQARNEYFNMRVRRYSLDSLAPRIWELRHNYTAYDAAYIALAEALNTQLATCDSKLEGTHKADVHVYK